MEYLKMVMNMGAFVLCVIGAVTIYTLASEVKYSSVKRNYYSILGNVLIGMGVIVAIITKGWWGIWALIMG